MKDSSFENNGGLNTGKGGAISISNSNLTIKNTNFTNNQAKKGGALYFSWTNQLKGFLNITNCVFSNNSASISGGSVQYDLYRPHFENNQFENNTAEYGPNIASYPIKIMLKDTDIDQVVLSDIGSGVEEIMELQLSLNDHDNQITTLENSAQIIIKEIEDSTLVTGQSAIVVKKGEVKFQVLSFESEQGRVNVPFELTSDAIDMTVMQRQYGEDFKLKDLIINFRF